MAQGRPSKPVEDRAAPMSIYPPASVRDRIISLAEADRRKPAQMAVYLIEKGLAALDAEKSNA